MAITTNNIFSESYAEVQSFLNGISDLDPRGRYKTNWIHASMPNINSKGFDGYPFIVLSIGVGESNPSFDFTVSEKTFRVLINIWSPQSTDIDSIADKIFQNLKEVTKLTAFDVTNLEMSPFNWDLDQNGKKILYRSVNLIARKRI